MEIPTSSSGIGRERGDEGFVRAIGLFDSIMVVAGAMIGSGIFLVSA